MKIDILRSTRCREVAEGVCAGETIEVEFIELESMDVEVPMSTSRREVAVAYVQARHMTVTVTMTVRYFLRTLTSNLTTPL